ncbi:MAG TPA: DOMON-like domain-containing protein [Pantanalinema sp.]
MKPTDFVLEPYPGLPFPAGVRVCGKARREGAALHLSWRLEGPPGSLALPLPAARPERRRELWEETCFEFFLASPERPGYWEFNLSPAGHWNVFHFDDYRAGMTDETAFEALPFTVSNRPEACEVSVCIDPTELGLAAAPWLLAVSTVVAEPGGRVTYWALSHPGTQPDFHHPDAFGVRLGE